MRVSIALSFLLSSPQIAGHGDQSDSSGKSMTIRLAAKSTLGTIAKVKGKSRADL
jgi:hypothetical protein